MLAGLTGAHFNPAITLAFMFKRLKTHSSKWLGVAYIIFQCGGAIFGSLSAMGLTNNAGDLRIKEGYHWTKPLFIEILGAAFITFFYMS
jgi:glycerol uptake facilitator-like aquaporin